MTDCHECKKKGPRLPKANELPLYENEKIQYTVEYDEEKNLPLCYEVSIVRKQFCNVFSYLGGIKDQATHVYETGIAHSQNTYDFITNEENIVPRVLTIASGGLAGIFLARRRGLFKKVIYGSFGSALVFSALYPSIAKDKLNSGFEFTKHHTTNILEKYGGYDTQKLSEEANSKMDSVKSFLMLEGFTSKLHQWFYTKKEKLQQSLNKSTDTSSEKQLASKE